MAGNFTPVGVSAEIKNLDQFTNGLKSMRDSISTTAQAASQTEAPMKQMSLSFSNVIDTVAGFTILQQAAGWLGDFARTSISTAIEIERLQIGNDALAESFDTTGEAMRSAIQTGSGGVINSLDAIRVANEAMIYGIAKTPEQMSEMAKIAVELGEAMGLGPVEGLNLWTEALGRNSPRMLARIGLVIKEKDALEIYAKSLGVAVEALDEEQQKEAFRQAALIKGREMVTRLGDAAGTVDEKMQHLRASTTDLGAELGKLAFPIIKLGVEAAIHDIEELRKQVAAWSYVFNEALPAIEAHNRELLRMQLIAAKSRGDEQAMAQALMDSSASFEGQKQVLFEVTGSYEEYNRIVNNINKTRSGFIFEQARVQALHMEAGEYGKLRPVVEGYNDAGMKTVSTQKAGAQSASQLAAEFKNLLHEVAGGTRALDDYNTRTMVLNNATLQTITTRRAQYDALTGIHQNWLVNEARLEAQWLQQQKDGLYKATLAQANYINSLNDMRRDQAQGGAQFGQDFTSTFTDRDKATEDAYQTHTDKLRSLAQERQEKINWVMTGAHARTKEENDAALAYWNAYYDDLLKKEEESYIQQNNDIDAKMRERQEALNKARAAELQAAEQHRKDMALQAVLGVVESQGKLEDLTGGAAKTASDAAALIKAGIIPVTGDLKVAIQDAWSGINTTMADTIQSQKDNVTTLDQIFSDTTTKADTTKTATEQQLTPMQQASQKVQDLKTSWLDAGATVATTAAQIVTDAGKVGEAFTGIATTADDSGKDIKKTFTEDIDPVKLGEDIAQGIANGMTAKKQAVLDAAADVAGGIETTIRTETQTQSPSRMTYEIGQDISQGLLDGIQSQEQPLEGGVRDTMREMFRNWWHEIRQGFGPMGGLSRNFRDLIDETMSNVTVPIGSTYAQAVQQAFEDLISRLPQGGGTASFIEYLRGQYGRLIEALGNQNNMLVSSLVANYLSAASALGGVANTLASQLSRNLGDQTVLTVDMVTASSDLADERERQLSAEQDILDLQQAQADLQLLQAQQNLLDLIQQYNLNPAEILGDLQLGLDADIGALLHATVAAMQAAVQQASESLAITPPVTPVPRYNPVPTYHPLHEVGGPITTPGDTQLGQPAGSGSYTGGIYVPGTAMTTAIPVQTSAGPNVNINFGTVNITSEMDMAEFEARVRQTIAGAI